MKKAIKLLLYTLFSLVLIISLTLFFIGNITKYVIEKYDTQYLGREISIQNIDINLFNASIEINGFNIYEKDRKTPFVRFCRLYTQTNYRSLLNNEIHFYPIFLNGLYINIKNKNGKLNFSDILQKVDSVSNSGAKQKNEIPISKPFKILLQNFVVKNGTFIYTDGDRNIKYWLSNYHLIVPEYNSDVNNVRVLLASNLNGVAKIGLDLNYDIKEQIYDAKLYIKNFPVKHIDNYLNEILIFKELTAYLDANIKAHGNIKNGSDFSVGGILKLNDFNFIDAYNQKLVSFKQLNINVDSLNIASNLYKINSITLTNPYLMFEMYDNGNSFNRLLKQTNTNIEGSQSNVNTSEITNTSSSEGNIFIYIYQYFKEISNDLLLSNYTAHKLQIIDGNIIYNDFTLGEKMNIEASKLNIHTSHISSSNDSVSAYLSSVLNQIGNLKVDYSADAKDFKDMTVNIDIETFPMTTFNAYSKYYTGFPFKKGGLTINNTIKISDNILDSKTRLLLEKTKTGRKDKKIRQKKIPLKLLLALLRDKKGDVDIAMPVTGNLNDPNYKLGPVILKILENLMVKTLTAPANLIGGAFSKNDQSEIEIECDFLDPLLSNKTKKSLLKLKDILIDKPELVLHIDYTTDTLKEKELLILREIKKKYLVEEKHMDSLSITDKNYKDIVPTDSLFIDFINKKIEGRIRVENSIDDKALSILGTNRIQQQYNNIKQLRTLQLNDFIETDLQEIKSRIKINNQTNDKNISNPYYILKLDVLEEP